MGLGWERVGEGVEKGAEEAGAWLIWLLAHYLHESL